MKKFIFLSFFIFSGTHLLSQTDSTRESAFIFPELKKRAWYVPLAEITTSNILVNRFDAYVKKAEWARVSPSSWKYNFQQGFKSDGDGFSNNFFGHPAHGSQYFNSARSLGYSFWESAAYTLGGSLVWEFLGETLAPSEIDINTTVQGGMYLGEITHRLSRILLKSNQKRPNRFLRNTAAVILNPIGQFNSWVDDDVSRNFRSDEADQLLIRSQLSVGFSVQVIELERIKPANTIYINYIILYGDIFDDTEGFKPFNTFLLNSWIDIPTATTSKSLFLNILSHAPWYKKKIRENSIFTISQHYDYIDNQAFKLGATGITADYLLQLKYRNWGFIGSVNLGIIPFGASSSDVIDALNLGLSDDEISKEYVYGRGFMAKLEYMIYHNNYGRATASFNNWYINTENYIQGHEHSYFLKFHYLYQFHKTISIGIERNVYRRDATYKDLPGYENIEEEYEELKILVTKIF